ncbi:MAG: family 1 glycosylhydrolase, partial [Bacteroidota bacterium]|nr:family 1 glycosylhydrolase [Bacteroidota bacterium]
KLAFDMDFIGIQNYTREIVSHAHFVPFLQAKIVRASKRKVERTMMNWEVYPQSIYEILKKYDKYEGIKEIIITENGAAFEDEVLGDSVHDQSRVNFLQDHIAQILKAKSEGVKVTGYFVWTLMDNFEWAEGFLPRFGLIYVNFNDNSRIIKSSGYWYKNFLSPTKKPSFTLQEDAKNLL